MTDISERLNTLSPAKLALLSKRLREKGQGAPKEQTIPRRREGSPTPLSLAQQRLWFLHELQPESAFYNTAGAMRLTGRLNVGALEQTLNEIVRRHEVLRTAFPVEHGKPLQIINPPAPLSLPITDLSDLPAAERESLAARLINDESVRPFDLAGGTPFRTALLRLGADEHVLLVTMHHIVSDGWSVGVFLREMAALYEAFSKGLPSPLPELSIQYADFAAWQEQRLDEGALGRQLDYWKRQLRGSNSTLDLTFGRPTPAAPAHRAGVESFDLPPALVKSLEALSRQEDVTLFVTLLSAFYVLLYRYTGQDDINVGSPIAGRSPIETEQLIGFFVNSLVLRGDLSGDPSFRELLRRVREMVLDAQSHQDVPFEKVVEALQPERSLMQTPLFQTVFSTDNVSLGSFELPGLTVTPFSVSNETTEFDLMCWVTRNGERMTATMTYRADLFDPATIRRMLGHFETLLENIVRGVDRSVATLPLMSPDEEQMVLFRWNDNAAPYQHTSIHEAFAAQVRRAPDAVALVFENEHLTYRALNDRAARLAHYLREVAGVGSETRVGICIERSFEMVVAVLGVLKAGGAYVPLDAAYPKERLSFMLADSDVKVLLTQSGLASQLPEYDGEVLCLDTSAESIAARSTADLPATATAESLAYIIYTSGSTGRPKGVMLQHGGVCNMAEAQVRDFELAPDGRVLQFASFSFDGAVSEMFLALLGGATLCLAPPQSLMPGEPLAATLRRQSVTYAALPPSVLAVLPAEDLPTLRTVVAAGEACPAHVVSRWAEGRLFINGYGPTENTVCTTLGRCDGSEAKPHIGSPIANVQVYLLDARLQPVPIGVAGELYISSVGLARGYLHLPALTAERFIPNPFSRQPGSRLYRTGDIARRLDDGAIDFVGRADEQVKLRGYRVELGEIEAALNLHPAVQDSVVVAPRDDRGNQRLVAYVVPRDEAASPGGQSFRERKHPAASIEILKEHLRARLPEYMVPASFVFLDTLPLTPNGKVDRRSLPAPDAAAGPPSLHLAPRTPAEELLADIWGDVLKLSHPGIRDNFFELGGHSLLATQVISRIREVLGVEVALRRLFEGPTIEALASAVESAQQGEAGPQQRVRIQRAAREPESGVVLSFAQQRLWFLDQMEPGNTLYNMPMALRLRGELDVDGLEWSLNEIVRRHETLRTRFGTEEGEPVQVIRAEWRVRLEVEEISAGSQAERGDEVRRRAQTEAQQRFDLAQGPLWTVRLLRTTADEHVLLLTMHHIISDGWSMGVLVREVAALYEAHRSGTGAALAPLPIQYADYAVWQREYLSGEVLEQQLAYWAGQLAGAPLVLELPSDRPRPPAQSFRGAALSFACSPELSHALRSLSKGEGATLYMTLLGAFAVLLYRYSGQSDMVIGTPIANRNRVETEGLIGFFVNTLAIRTRVGGDPTFRELVKRVREVVLGAYAHQDVPFERVVEELKPERDLSRSPIFQVMMTWQNAPVEELELEGVEISYVGVPTETVKYDLGLTMWERMGSGEVEGAIDYATDLFDEERVRRMSEHFVMLLENIVAAPDAPISSLHLLSDSETEGFRHLNTPDSGLSHEEFENILLEIKTALDE